MLFNSFEYLVFLPTIFLLYWFLFKKSIGIQNLLLLVASYLFYGWWDWRFLSLIIFSSIIDYYAGLAIDKSKIQKNRKLWLSLSMSMNLGFLAIFKYYNFFANELQSAFSNIGYEFNSLTLDIILPVGISFYTFQTMSYTIDIYRKQLKPTKDIIAFFAFVSFFPQLVAGPIERATNLLPQFYKKRVFNLDKAKDGLRQIAWGLFKKIVVADNCAIIVNKVFDNYTEFNSSTLVVAAIFFAFQIYCDFSGYSDIAIGTSRLFGFNLMQNFAFPYFSRDIAEFWRRWHISLSTWFRDYVYIPLGGSKGGLLMKIRNTFIIFIVSGFWHGANWTFIVWGALNAIYFLPLLLTNQNRKNLNIPAEGKQFITLKEIFQIILTFSLTVMAWIFFRAANVTTAIDYITNMFSNTIFSKPEVSLMPLTFIFILVVTEWLQRGNKHGLEIGDKKIIKPIRWAIYYTLIIIIFWYGAPKQEFIYFQF